MAGGMERFVVERGGERLDKLLAQRPSVSSRRRATEVLDTGKVHIDGRQVLAEEGGLPVPAGAAIEIHWNAPGSGLARRKGEHGLTQAGLRILHEDADIIAVDKPPGLLTDVADPVQAKERDSVKKRLHTYLKPRGREPQVCHRIDRDTSGVVLFATHERSGEALRAQFANHEPERTYWLAVHGVPEPREGTWEDWMVWDKVQLLQRVTKPNAPGAMLARAHYKVIEAFADSAIVEVRLDTGRRNQIRLHTCERGHPILGERLYLPPRFHIGRWQLPRQALHARRVTFKHPVTGASITVESPLPPDLQAVVRKMAQPPEPVGGAAPPRRMTREDRDEGGRHAPRERRPEEQEEPRGRRGHQGDDAPPDTKKAPAASKGAVEKAPARRAVPGKQRSPGGPGRKK